VSVQSGDDVDRRTAAAVSRDADLDTDECSQVHEQLLEDDDGGGAEGVPEINYQLQHLPVKC